MEKHDFIPADRDKIRHFLRDVNAITASITRTEIRWGDVNGIPGKTGRAGCEAAVRQPPLATGRATMPAYSRGNSTIEKNNATCQRATNREHTTKTKNRAPATFGAT